jgi:hypothetical protein
MEPGVRKNRIQKNCMFDSWFLERNVCSQCFFWDEQYKQYVLRLMKWGIGYLQYSTLCRNSKKTSCSFWKEWSAVVWSLFYFLQIEQYVLLYSPLIW